VIAKGRLHRVDSNNEQTHSRSFEVKITTSGHLDARALTLFKEATDVTLRCQHVSNLDDLSTLPRLRWLCLEVNTISGSDFIFDEGFHSVESLHLRGTDVDDGNLFGINKLQRLRNLSLPNTSISDTGLEAIGYNPRLESLSIAGTGISDASIDTIITLGSLRRLDVAGSQISDAGITRLKKELPELESLMRMGEVFGDDGQSMGSCYFDVKTIESDSGVLERRNVADKLTRKTSD